MGDKLVVYIDNREKNPYTFPGHEMRWTTLNHGDYTCYGLKGVFELERKSVHDLLCTMVMKQRWAAWLRKCERWSTAVERYGTPRIVIVEGQLSDIHRLPPHVMKNVEMRGLNLFYSRLQMMALMGIHFMFCSDREIAARMVLGLLGRELESREKGVSVADRLYKREPELTVPSTELLSASAPSFPGIPTPQQVSPR